MSLINVTNLTFAYDGSYENIFENVNFQIDTNWKLGFAGRNGRGKTTFLNLLLGKYEYRGSISEGDLLWAMKNICYMDMRQAEAHRIMEITRRKDYLPVRVTTNMHDLVERANTQNFVPVVDDKDAFIGIVTRSSIIRYCCELLFPED